LRKPETWRINLQPLSLNAAPRQIEGDKPAPQDLNIFLLQENIAA